MTRLPTLGVKRRRDLRRRAGTYGAVAMTVFVGIVLFAASNDAYANLQASYDATFDRLHVADITVTGTDAAVLAGVAGVDTVVERHAGDVPMRVGGRKFLGRVVGMPAGMQPAIDAVEVTSGQYLPAGRADTALAETHLADHDGLGGGDRVQVLAGTQWETLEVVGVAASAEYLWPARNRQEVLTDPDDFGVVFVPEAVAERLTGAAGAEVLATYAPDVDREALDREIEAVAREHGALDVVTRADQPSNAALSMDIKGFQEMAFFFPILFLTAAGLTVYVLLARLVHAQRPVIGMLVANGVARRVVRRHYAGFGVIVALTGAVPGAVVGAALGAVLANVYTQALSIPLTTTSFHPMTLVVGIAFGVVAGWLAAAIPARAATRVEPAAAMRGDVPVPLGRVSLFERLTPALAKLPTSSRMVLRNVGRNRRRTAATAGGVVLALALVVVSLGMLDSMNALLERQRLTFHEDARLTMSGPIDTATLARIGAVGGVATVEPAARYPAVFSHGDDAVTALVEAVPAGSQMRDFDVGRGTFLGAALAEELHVGPGDTVEMQTADGSRSVRVEDVVDDQVAASAYAVLDGAPNVALVRFDAGADREEARRQLTGIEGVATYADSRALDETLERFMGLFRVIVGVMLAFGAMLAAALLYAAVTVNVAERRCELALLRAEGVGRRQLGRLVTKENLAVASLGIVPGLLAGLLLTSAFLDSIDTDLFHLTADIRPQSLLIAVAAVVAATVVAQWPALRGIGSLDIAAVVRERSM